MQKSKLHLTILFSLLVFCILFLTMIFMLCSIVLVTQYKLFYIPHDYIGFIWFSIASIFIGTTFANFIGKRSIRFFASISEASKKVAKGDFNVQIDENMKVKELREMSHNFNLMIRELAGMEMFRNDFISNVSHEFKTPLSAIEGYTTLLQTPNLPEDKKQFYISKILYNTNRLSELTGHILLLSRLENQNISIPKSTFSLDEQIRQIILLFERDWTEKNIDLDINLEEINYLGNEELLAQVWQNIIGNALKFTNPNGKIKVFMESNDKYIVIDIIDNGIGIDEATQARIFEKFYQGDKSHTIKGNGLGLALSKQIIELHNGSISVSSQKDKGSKFTISLPV